MKCEVCCASLKVNSVGSCLKSSLFPGYWNMLSFYSRILKELAKAISEFFIVISEDSQCRQKMENGRTECLC